MKIKTTKAQLLSAVASVRNAASPKSTLPMLANVLIASDGDGVTVSATDLIVTLSATVAGAEAEHGSAAVSARALFDVIKNAADGPVVLDVEENGMRVKAGRSKFKLPIAPGAEFPAMPVADASFVDVPCDVLSNLLSMTHYAAAVDASRAHIAGVHLKADGARLTASATDSSRGCRAAVDVDGVGEWAAFVPGKGVHELRGLLSDGNVSMSIGTEHLFARVGETTLCIKLGDDAFPPLDKLIGMAVKKSTRRFNLDRMGMLDALRRVEVVASGKEIALVAADIADGTLTLSGANQDVGEGSDALDVDYAGDPVRVAFSPRYIADVLGAVVDDTVSVAICESLDPIVITSDANCDFVGLVMPMREPGQ